MHKFVPFFLFLFLSLTLSAQSNEQFYSELDKAWQAENEKFLVGLFDKEVDYSLQGRKAKFNRLQLEGALKQFFTDTRPGVFTLKHKGSSENGQLYFIGQLETSEGNRYKVVCRARRVAAGYRIFRLDMD